MKLIHAEHAQMLSNRTLNALRGYSITDWEQLVAEACKQPNIIRSIDGLGPKGVAEIITALNSAKVPHTIRTRRS